jgi:predicted protein tyrosine phosphatase
MSQSTMNRIHNSSNPYQKDFKKVLCVCSAGLLRSPTAALVLSQDPYNFNTRAAGIEESYALIAVDEVLLRWSDEIVCMTEQHERALRAKFAEQLKEDSPVILTIGVPDIYAYRDAKLIALIAANYDAALARHKESVK